MKAWEYGPDTVDPIMEALQTELERVGWSKAELARKAGLDTGTVNRAMRGETSPTLRTVHALAEALDLTIEVTHTTPVAAIGANR